MYDLLYYNSEMSITGINGSKAELRRCENVDAELKFATVNLVASNDSSLADCFSESVIGLVKVGFPEAPPGFGFKSMELTTDLFSLSRFGSVEAELFLLSPASDDPKMEVEIRAELVGIDISSLETSVCLSNEGMRVGAAVLVMPDPPKMVVIQVRNNGNLSVSNEGDWVLPCAIMVAMDGRLNITAELPALTIYALSGATLIYSTRNFAGAVELYQDAPSSAVEVGVVCKDTHFQFGSRVRALVRTMVFFTGGPSGLNQTISIGRLEFKNTLGFASSYPVQIQVPDLQIGGELDLDSNVEVICTENLTLNMGEGTTISRLALAPLVHLTIRYRDGADPFEIDELSGSFHPVVSFDFDEIISQTFITQEARDYRLLFHTGISGETKYQSAEKWVDIVDGTPDAIVVRLNAAAVLRYKAVACIVNNKTSACASYASVFDLGARNFLGSTSFCRFDKPAFVIGEDLTMDSRVFSGLLSSVCGQVWDVRARSNTLRLEGIRTGITLKVSPPRNDPVFLELASLAVTFIGPGKWTLRPLVIVSPVNLSVGESAQVDCDGIYFDLGANRSSSIGDYTFAPNFLSVGSPLGLEIGPDAFARFTYVGPESTNVSLSADQIFFWPSGRLSVGLTPLTGRDIPPVRLVSAPALGDTRAARLSLRSSLNSATGIVLAIENTSMLMIVTEATVVPVSIGVASYVVIGAEGAAVGRTITFLPQEISGGSRYLRTDSATSEIFIFESPTFRNDSYRIVMEPTPSFFMRNVSIAAGQEFLIQGGGLLNAVNVSNGSLLRLINVNLTHAVVTIEFDIDSARTAIVCTNVRIEMIPQEVIVNVFVSQKTHDVDFEHNALVLFPEASNVTIFEWLSRTRLNTTRVSDGVNSWPVGLVVRDIGGVRGISIDLGMPQPEPALKEKAGLVVGVIAGVLFVIVLGVVMCFVLKRRRRGGRVEIGRLDDDAVSDPL
jgi:hypothetical protein